MITHCFTVDVEEYFQVAALTPHVGRDTWDQRPSRVDVGLDRLLDLLARHGATATFFTLGWLADRRPALVRRIVEAGHEVASHGWDHQKVTCLNPESFRRDVRLAKAVLENATGTRVLGYRAPSFSITRSTRWALDVLLEEGYLYDSSLFPVRRPGYGFRGGHPDMHWLDCAAGRLLEVPPATLGIGTWRLPAAGGAYLRHLPPALVHAAFRSCERRARPGTFYVHPWELDPDQPRLPVSAVTAWRHYGGLRRTERRVEALLSEFRFRAIVSVTGLN